MGVDRVGERGDDVLGVGAQPGARVELVRTPQTFGGMQGEVGVIARVPVAQHVDPAVLDEPFLAVLADRLQQPVAGIQTTSVSDHERSGHEIGQ